MIEKIRQYLVDQNVITNKNKINVDFLGLNPSEFAIMKIETEPVIERYVDGSTLRQFQFELISCNEYSKDIVTNMANSTFYDDLSDLIEKNNKEHILPSIDGIETIECLDNGALLNSQTNKARYSIQMRITYFKEA